MFQHRQMKATWMLLGIAMFCNPVQAVDFDWSLVGDAGNFAGPETYGRVFGAVAYDYRIDKFEVTNSQYAGFLNAKDPTGTNALALYNASMSTDANGGITYSTSATDGSKYSIKPGYASHPVNFVSWFDAIRFVNWLNNGQANGSTETGAYTLLGGTPTPSNAKTITRNPGAMIVLPSEDEWYKAAYYDPNKSDNLGYWLYPTSSDTPPTSAPPSSTPNTANILGNGFALTPGVGNTGSDVQPGVDYLTDVGAYTNSASHYGTYDQAGNLWEWNESLWSPNGSAGIRGNMGGSFYNRENLTTSLGWAASNAYVQEFGLGFRIVSLKAHGDGTGDGLVDGADYVVWADHFLQSSALGDAAGDFNHDGVIDGVDYTMWSDNFAPPVAQPSSALSVASVPEPSSAVLAVIGALACLRWTICRWPSRGAALAVLACAMACFANTAQAVDIEWVTVGDPGNFAGPETNGRVFGAVPYIYRIDKYEVTNTQYVEFLNTKDPGGGNMLGLYNVNMGTNANGGIYFDNGAAAGTKYSVRPGSANHPVNYVNWFDAIRFTNWLNNGQGNADTESGAYTLTGGTPIPSNAKAVVRNAGASVVLTTEDEWYKAAFYDPTKSGESLYWIYPTQSDEQPLFVPPSSTPNSANMRDDVTGYAMTPGIGPPLNPNVNYLSDVGAYSGSPSYYGTFDQAGNVFEWNEALRMPGSTAPSGVRGVMGGSFASDYSFAQSLGWAASTASVDAVNYGFRVVSLKAFGDGTGDGRVDGADYVVWADHFLQTSDLRDAAGDFNHDGVIDGADYTLWSDSFAPALALPLNSVPIASVPEPSGILLALLGIATIAIVHSYHGRLNQSRIRSSDRHN